MVRVIVGADGDLREAAEVGEVRVLCFFFFSWLGGVKRKRLRSGRNAAAAADDAAISTADAATSCSTSSSSP